MEGSNALVLLLIAAGQPGFKLGVLVAADVASTASVRRQGVLKLSYTPWGYVQVRMRVCVKIVDQIHNLSSSHLAHTHKSPFTIVTHCSSIKDASKMV